MRSYCVLVGLVYTPFIMVLGTEDEADMGLREEFIRVQAALVETARLLTLEQLQQTSKETVLVLVDLGLLGHEQLRHETYDHNRKRGKLSQE